MGSICHINRNPKTWTAIPSGKKTKPEYGDEPLIKITYGDFDDDPGGTFELVMLMRKSIYDKLISGEYSVMNDSSRLRSLRVCDRAGQYVKPLGESVY